MRTQETEELHVNYGPRQTQSANVHRLEKRGFKNEGDTHIGIVLAKIDSENYVQKYVVGISGAVRKYKPYKATIRDLQRLPRDSSKVA